MKGACKPLNHPHPRLHLHLHPYAALIYDWDVLKQHESRYRHFPRQHFLVPSFQYIPFRPATTLMTATDILQSGSMVRDRWKVLLKVRDLPSTQLYQAFDLVTRANVSLKVESACQQIQKLKMDVTVLRRLQGKDHIHRFLGGGTNELYNYVVTTCQGGYLDRLRRNQPECCFPLSESIRLSLQVLKCIETIHSIGFLHRNIQACNFVMGCSPSTF